MPKTFGNLLIGALFISLLTECSPEPSQSPYHTEIDSVISGMFDAMRQNDGSRLKELFYGDVDMKIVDHTADTVQIRSNTPDAFISAINQPKDEVWDEQYDNLQVSVDGKFATAIMDYGFYRGEVFSHCGSNVFSLVQTTGGWKVFSIIYSRRTEGCEKWQ